MMSASTSPSSSAPARWRTALAGWIAGRPGVLVLVTLALALLAFYVEVLQRAVARGPLIEVQATPAVATRPLRCEIPSDRDCPMTPLKAAGRTAATTASALP